MLYKTLAEALLSGRAERGWSQERAADFIGCSARALRYWEEGLRVPSPKQFKRIRLLTGVAVTDLIRLRLAVRGVRKERA